MDLLSDIRVGIEEWLRRGVGSRKEIGDVLEEGLRVREKGKRNKLFNSKSEVVDGLGLILCPGQALQFLAGGQKLFQPQLSHWPNLKQEQGVCRASC